MGEGEYTTHLSPLPYGEDFSPPFKPVYNPVDRYCITQSLTGLDSPSIMGLSERGWTMVTENVGA